VSSGREGTTGSRLKKKSFMSEKGERRGSKKTRGRKKRGKKGACIRNRWLRSKRGKIRNKSRVGFREFSGVSLKPTEGGKKDLVQKASVSGESLLGRGG